MKRPRSWPAYFGAGLAFTIIALLLETRIQGHPGGLFGTGWVRTFRTCVLLLPWVPAIFLLVRRLRTKRNSHWVAYTCGAALPFAFFATVFFGPGVIEVLGRRKFDPAAWKAAAYVPDERAPTNDRLKMVDDLIDSGVLAGKTHAEVEALLGPDDGPRGTGYSHLGYRGWDAVYYLGPERGFFGIDSEWLLIRYDEDGRVRQVRITSD